MSEPKVAREFFEQHLPVDLKKSLDFNRLKACKESYVDETLRLNYVDMLFTVKLDNHPACLWLLLENTSKTYPKLPLTLLKYTVNIMEDQYNKCKKIPLVYPLVLHHNEKAYTGTTDIRDMIDAPRLLVDNYFLKPFQVVDLNTIDDTKLRETTYAGIVQTVLKYSRARDFLIHLEELMKKELKIVLASDDEYFILSILNYSIMVAEGKSVEPLAELTDHYLSKPLGEKIMTLAQRLEQRGRQEMQTLIAKKLLSEGTELAFVAKITGLPITYLQELQADLDK